MEFKVKIYYKKWLLVLVAVFFAITAILAASFFIFETTYKNKVYCHIFLGETSLAKKSYKDAYKIIESKTDSLNQNGIKFIYTTPAGKNQEIIINPTIASIEGDFAINIISFDAEKTAQNAYDYGRNENFKNNLKNKLNLLFGSKKINLEYKINENEIKKILENNLSLFTTPPQNASLIATSSSKNSEEIIFTISPEKPGETIDYNKAVNELKNNLSTGNISAIYLQAEMQNPSITTKEATGLENDALALINKAPFTIKYEKYSWKIDRNTLADWLTLEKNNTIYIDINHDKASEYLDKNIGQEINQEAIEPRFEFINGKVVKFQASQDGKQIDLDKNIENISNALLTDTSTEIQLEVKITKAEADTSVTNNLGIEEIIGVGKSNFSGSPKNRRHNIKIGASAVNGTLVKPGEEFSLVKTLGSIDEKSGYLPELVIKGGKTIPEYGGGLCQIGTTVFRGVVDSGLPVTMRQNHSYRVSYYEPAGTDATIYDPWPDFRFINDTQNYILIQSRFEGDILYFEFWGKKDGRIVKKTDPIISNIVKPEPTKIIETLDLPVGQKKCTEHAHNGADAYFDYAVTYSDGTKKEERFKSHYVPWREVCLIGVEALTVPTPEISTSTTQIISTTTETITP